MATMKDIARLAGVSHGTVSNVLNGRGNVSLEKIKKVEKACRELNYKINLQAKHLRKSVANILAVILPHIQAPEYLELYNVIRRFSEENNRQIELHITDDLPSKELDILSQLDVERLCGVLVISCLGESNLHEYKRLINNQVPLLFLEREPLGFSGPALYFDYAKAANDIATKIQEEHPEAVSIGLFTLSSSFTSESRFIEVATQLLGANRNLMHVETDIKLAYSNAFVFFENGMVPDIIVTSKHQLAVEISKVCRFLKLDRLPVIYTIASTECSELPNTRFYKLNYDKLGREACSMLFQPEHERASHVLESDGFPSPYRFNLHKKADSINVLTLDCPSTDALKQLAPAFTEETGIKVNFAVFSHEEVYSIINDIQNYQFYDVIRLDVVWLPRVAKKALLELDFDSMGFDRIRQRVIPNTLENFSMVNNKCYALPFDLSIQLLFYRKDIYEDAKVKRLYYEQNKKSLELPKNYREFNDVSAFFTKSLNRFSPVTYGTVMPSGNMSVITCEFMSRMHDLGESLFEADGRTTRLDSEKAVMALRQYKEAFKYSPPIGESAWWTHSVQRFASGEVAHIVVFINYAPPLINSRISNIVGNIGYAPIPGNHPAIGGGALGISKYSSKIDEGIEFLKWVSSEETAMAYSLVGGVSPYESTFSNSQILSMYPWLPLAQQGIMNGTVKRLLDRDNTDIDEHVVDNILGLAIKNYLLDITNEYDALYYAKRQIDQLMYSNDKPEIFIK